MIANPSFKKWRVVTPSDTVNFTNQGLGRITPDAFYIGGAGNVVLVFEDDSTLTLAVVAGMYIWHSGVKRINSTNTTSAAIYALYGL